jgi:hypothetical protein
MIYEVVGVVYKVVIGIFQVISHKANLKALRWDPSG